MIVTQAPLRISLLGGNTDFPEYFNKYGGLVLTTTIDKYIYCIITPRYDDQIRVNYSVKEIVNNIDELKHDLVRESLRLLNITKGVEISFLSDIPSKGSGLGSSSSLLVGLLIALHRYNGETVSSIQIAEEACQIEIDILKKPIGVQDQYIAALGGLREIQFPYCNYNGLIELSTPQRDYINNCLMLFSTGIWRGSEEILNNINLDKDILDNNKELAEQGVIAIKEADMETLGKLVSTYWEDKKKLSKSITNPLIDDMYKLSMNAGAYGGKIVGAGGGGFLFLLVPPEKRQAIRNSLSNFRELNIKLERDGGKVIFDYRSQI